MSKAKHFFFIIFFSTYNLHNTSLRSQFQALFGIKPTIMKMPMFGCFCYFLIWWKGIFHNFIISFLSRRCSRNGMSNASNEITLLRDAMLKLCIITKPVTFPNCLLLSSLARSCCVQLFIPRDFNKQRKNDAEVWEEWRRNNKKKLNVLRVFFAHRERRDI